MTRSLLPLYLCGAFTAGAWTGYGTKMTTAADEAAVAELAPGVRVFPTGPYAVPLPPRGAQEGGILAVNPEPPVPVSSPPSPRAKEPRALTAAQPAFVSQLDAIDARLAALEHPSPRHCYDACLAGVERVEIRRGEVACKCRRVPSLGVYRLAGGAK